MALSVKKITVNSLISSNGGLYLHCGCYYYLLSLEGMVTLYWFIHLSMYQEGKVTGMDPWMAFSLEVRFRCWTWTLTGQCSHPWRLSYITCENAACSHGRRRLMFTMRNHFSQLAGTHDSMMSRSVRIHHFHLRWSCTSPHQLEVAEGTLVPRRDANPQCM